MEKIKRKSGMRFRESLTINGRTIKSPIFTRKTDATQWLANERSRKFETMLYGDSFKLKDKLLFQEYAETWLTGKRSIGLSRACLDNYERYLRVHYASLAKLDMKRITKQDLEKFQAELAKTHNAKGTNLIMTALKAIFAEAVKEGYLIRNPALGMKKLSEDNAVEMYWTKAEINQFMLANLKDSLYDLYLVALNTGMRKGELAGLKWDRVDFGLNQITVSRTRDADELKERTKTNLKRVVPMNQTTRMILLKVFQERNGVSDFVFVDKNGLPIEVHHIYRKFGLAQVQAKLANKIRFHDLRHTFASQFMMNNGNVFDLQKILGHTDIKMTMRYAHYSPEHLQKAMQGFELGKTNDLAQISPTAFEKRSLNRLEDEASAS